MLWVWSLGRRAPSGRASALGQIAGMSTRRRSRNVPEADLTLGIGVVRGNDVARSRATPAPWFLTRSLGRLLRPCGRDGASVARHPSAPARLAEPSRFALRSKRAPSSGSHA
jgi:hypothetical protein